MQRATARLAGFSVVLVGLTLGLACDFSVGPNLGAVYLRVTPFPAVPGVPETLEVVPPAEPRLQPTADPGDFPPGVDLSVICCCRVVGKVLNTGSVPAHVTLKFEAFATGEEDPIGTAVEFFEAVPAGGMRDVAAPGLLRPCATIDRVVLADTDLRAAQ